MKKSRFGKERESSYIGEKVGLGKRRADGRTNNRLFICSLAGVYFIFVGHLNFIEAKGFKGKTCIYATSSSGIKTKLGSYTGEKLTEIGPSGLKMWGQGGQHRNVG
jgi:hypothetical protein